jgi:hypothetical protein
MATKSVDYLAKDMDSIVDALITYATVNYGTGTAGNRQWTSFNVDDFSRTWLELVAYVGDLIFFYLDVQATQSNLETATLRQAVLNIAKQYGYAVPTPSSASGKVTFTLSGPGTIPAYTRLVAENGSEFFTTEVLTTSTTVVTRDVIQGARKYESFAARGVQNEEVILGFSSIVVDQAISITALRSPLVSVGGTIYTLVDTFIRSLPSDTHYKISLDSSGKATLQFGDGIFGRQLSPNDSVKVDYRTGGGSIGNIPANTLTTLTDSLKFVTSVTNLSPFSGGTDDLSIAHLKATIPFSLNTLERAVTLDDYANIILANFSGVAKASASTSTYYPGTDIDIFVVPAGTTITNITDNPVLSRDITSFLDKRKLVTTTFGLKDASGTNILFKLVVYLNPGSSKTSIKNNIISALSDFFDFNTGDTDQRGTKFAQIIKLKDLNALISTLSGIDRFEFIKCTSRPNVVATQDADYLIPDVEIYSNCEENEWLVGAEYYPITPLDRAYIPYTVFKKINGIVTSIDTDSLTDNMLNLSVLEGTSTGVITSGADNTLYDSTKTFKTDEFVTSYLLVDSSRHVWTITSNDSHSITCATTSLDDAAVTYLVGGDYKVVKSYIGETVLFNDLIVPGINYNTNDSVAVVGYGFDLVGTVGDKFQISVTQTNKGNFGVPATALTFTEDTPSTGLGRFQCAGSPNLSDVSANPGNYILVDTNLNAYDIDAANDILKTVDILYDSTVTTAPSVAATGTPISITKPYYPDNNEIGFSIGIADSLVGSGLQALGTIVLASTLTRTDIPDSKTFTIHDLQKSITTTGAVRVSSTGIVTLTTTTVHGMLAGDFILVSGVTNTGFNSTSLFQILTVPTTSTLTYSQAGVDASSGGGTVTRVNTFEFKVPDISGAPASSVTEGTRTVDILDTVCVYDLASSGNTIPINLGNSLTNAAIKTAIVNAINTRSSGYTRLLVEAYDGNATMTAETDQVVKLLYHTVGTAGNLPIALTTPAITGLTFNGMSGGLDTGHSIADPTIHGSGDPVNAFGRKTSNNTVAGTVDHFIFRTSNYLGDIVTLGEHEIPELISDDIEFDIRGGLE